MTDASVPLTDSYIDNHRRVQPHHANTVGTLHGGNLVQWLDDVAAMSAMRFADHDCVTVTIDKITFEEPIPVGDIAHIRAYVFETRTTSLQVRVRAAHEDPYTGEETHITDSCFTFVAVDDDGTPQEVPDVVVETARGAELQAAAHELHGND